MAIFYNGVKLLKKMVSFIFLFFWCRKRALNWQLFSPKCELFMLLVAWLDNFLMPAWMINMLIYFAFLFPGWVCILTYFRMKIDKGLMLTTWVCFSLFCLTL